MTTKAYLSQARYIEQIGTNENVSVLRDGKTYQYSEVTANE